MTVVADGVIEDPEDETAEEGFDADLFEAMCDEGSQKARELLGIPAPNSNFQDIEVEAALMYLAYSASYYVLDKINTVISEYSRAQAKFDLDLLRKAIDKVEKQLDNKKLKKRVRIVELTPGADGCAYSGQKPFEQQVAEALALTMKKNEAKLQVTRIGGRKGVSQ